MQATLLIAKPFISLRLELRICSFFFDRITGPLKTDHYVFVKIDRNLLALLLLINQKLFIYNMLIQSQ